MYAIKTEPAIVAKPEVMARWISEVVMTLTYGLTRQADSPWPMKGDAAAITASAPDTFIVLKKNQALKMREIRCEGGKGRGVSDDAQVFNDPLHNTEVVHHLHEGNEKHDSAQYAGEEPALGDHDILIEEEDGADTGFLQEVGREESKPLEDLEASIGLEDEESDGLLEEETDDDRLPMRVQVREDVIRTGD